MVELVQTDIEQDFYIVAREPGAEHPALPTWASATDNPAKLDLNYQGCIERIEIEDVPGAFQLLNVISPKGIDKLT